MLGSLSKADDAVQESWLRLSRADTSGVENLPGWLTTVVGRVCLDMLRARASRREEPFDTHAPEQMGASQEVRGAAAVADTFVGRARAARPALIDGVAGAVWAPGGRPQVVVSFTVRRGKIVAIDLVTDLDRLHQLDLTILDH
jgi:hypothetical protein